MGRQLVRLTDGSGFTLGGERVDNGARLELQLEGDCWIGGTIGWSSTLDDAILFIVKLGGPHERHSTTASEVHLRLHPADAYFRHPAKRGN